MTGAFPAVKSTSVANESVPVKIVAPELWDRYILEIGNYINGFQSHSMTNIRSNEAMVNTFFMAWLHLTMRNWALLSFA